MRWVSIYVSLFFMRILDNVKPYFIRVNTFIRSISGILTKNNKETNGTIIVGFMEHDPKMSAIHNHKHR